MWVQQRAVSSSCIQKLDSEWGPQCQAGEEPQPRERRGRCAAVATVPEAAALRGQGSAAAARSPQLGSRVPSELGETPHLYGRAWQVTQGHVPMSVHLGPPRKVSPGPGSGTRLPLNGAGRGGHERLDRTQGDREAPPAARDSQLLESRWPRPGVALEEVSGFQ